MKELEVQGFVQLLALEQTSAERCKEFARACSDLGLKELYEDFAQRHKEHYETLRKEMQKMEE